MLYRKKALKRKSQNNTFMPTRLFFNSLDRYNSSRSDVWFYTKFLYFMQCTHSSDARHSLASELVYTVCQRPFYGTQGINKQ